MRYPPKRSRGLKSSYIPVPENTGSVRQVQPDGIHCQTLLIKEMKPRIDSTRFGSITLGGEVIKHDVLIRLDGQVKKRKKKLSKQKYGTSHLLSVEEAEYIYEGGARRLIFGTGQFGRAKLSEEAAEYFKQKECQVELLSTPSAVKAWNDSKGAIIGLFHVTC